MIYKKPSHLLKEDFISFLLKVAF